MYNFLEDVYVSKYKLKEILEDLPSQYNLLSKIIILSFIPIGNTILIITVLTTICLTYINKGLDYLNNKFK